jgi:hypothetical protein
MLTFEKPIGEIPEMQFKTPVFADEFTPRELSARPPTLFSKSEPEAFGEKYGIEDF